MVVFISGSCKGGHVEINLAFDLGLVSAKRDALRVGMAIWIQLQPRCYRDEYIVHQHTGDDKDRASPCRALESMALLPLVLMGMDA